MGDLTARVTSHTLATPNISSFKSVEKLKTDQKIPKTYTDKIQKSVKIQRS